MKFKLLISLIFVCVISSSYGQKSKKGLFSPTKFGIQFIQGNENSFLFNDPDYFYRSNTLKGQFYYPFTKWKSMAISLILQPQLQFIQHQLYNEHFVKPTEDDYLEKRKRYTQLKNLSIFAVALGLEAKKQVFKSTSIFFQIGLGLGYVDMTTERLAKGFTFTQNGNLGLDIKVTPTASIQIFGGIGHVSNANIQLPNSGYNMFNTGVGFLYNIK